MPFIARYSSKSTGRPHLLTTNENSNSIIMQHGYKVKTHMDVPNLCHLWLQLSEPLRLSTSSCECNLQFLLASPLTLLVESWL